MPVIPADPDWQDRYLRALAELENYRVRTERDRAARAQYASEPVIRKVLDPVDSLDRAVGDLEALLRESPDAIRVPLSRSLEGLKALRRQFRAVLDSEGVVSFGEEGAAFDPNLHEALLKLPSDQHPEGIIAQVIQPGYMLRGRVIRPARVSVSSGPPEPAAPSADLPAGAKPTKHGRFGKRSSSPEANPPGHSNNENQK
jgi:molecular chaperone GrpE